jgi:hypothetical protein
MQPTLKQNRITIKNSENIMYSDVGDGWTIDKIRSSLNHYHISINNRGYNHFIYCTISRKPTPIGLFIIKYGNVYNAITKDQLKNMKYVVRCITDLLC